MLDIRRILIIFVVGILYSVLVFSTIQAVYPSPDYSDYCGNDYRVPKLAREEVECPDHNIDQTSIDECADSKGMPKYSYDPNGCVSSWECSYCQRDYDEAREHHNFWSFLIATILGLAAIVISLYLPMKKGSVHEWIGSGLMLGGLVSIFVGTMMYFGDIHRIARPIVILLELILVIWLAYNKLGK